MAGTGVGFVAVVFVFGTRRIDLVISLGK